jgi:aspartate/methionine/tyrosine aminotransferase
MLATTSCPWRFLASLYFAVELAVTPARAKLQESDLPGTVLKSEYAVRGEIVLRAQEIQAELDAAKQAGVAHTKYGFDKLVPCNIGNPQAVGQSPLTYHRQMLSIVTTSPKDMKHNGTEWKPLAEVAAMPRFQDFPLDVIARGYHFLKAGNIGAYSHSKGALLFRQKIAQYIDRRDAVSGAPKVNVEDIFITDGASPAVKTVLELLIRDEKDVVLIPIPQYPLYSASIVRLGGTYVGYELTEDYTAPEDQRGWNLDVPALETLVQTEKAKGNNVRGIAVINPGNPTGNVLTEDVITAIVQFAERHDMVILADEVYQENVYNLNPSQTDSKPKEFVSFRTVLYKIGSSAELFSFHSVSKGYYGECGLRGGYVQLDNIDEGINEQMYKLMSMTLCSNTVGQAMMASVTNPPDTADYLSEWAALLNEDAEVHKLAEKGGMTLTAQPPSFALFEQEKSDVLKALQKKAVLTSEYLNSVPGISSMPIEGAMYAFPQVRLPQKYITHARSVMKKEPDSLYCLEMLEALGVIAVPGNGFRQKMGTFHLRLTILPQEEELLRVFKGVRKFHMGIYRKWGVPEGINVSADELNQVVCQDAHCKGTDREEL